MVHPVDAPSSSVAARLAWTFALLGLLPIGGALSQRALEAVREARSLPSGRLVDVGGRKIHLRCLGQGNRTVVFESGGLGSSAEWERVLPEVARRTRACAYDRAGMGWSDPIPGERSARDFTDDLRRALDAAGERAPYVLVGHSAGGVLVRSFQAAYPREVSALVLVDTGTAGLLGRWPRIVASWHRELEVCRGLAAFGVLSLLDPLHVRGGAAAFTYRPRTFFAAEQLVNAIVAELPRLPGTTDLPTVVLAHGREAGDWAGPYAIDRADASSVERDWQSAQRELASGRQGSLTVAADSGHMIPIERPDLVVQAVENVLE